DRLNVTSTVVYQSSGANTVMGTRCNEFKLVSLLSLFYHEVQQREDAVIIYCIMACCNSSRNIRILRDLYPKATKGIGHFSKVWVFQLGTRDSAGIITFLVGADGAIFLIVHNDDKRFGTVLGGGGNFLTVHEEFAVAGN